MEHSVAAGVEEPDVVSPGAEADEVGARPRMDLLRMVVIAMLACYVWRVQDLFSILTTTQVALVVSILGIALFAASPTALRNLSRARYPAFKLATFLFAWTVLSIPTSLYPGLSFSFVVDDHVKTFWLMLLVIVSVREFADLERYSFAQVLGGALYCWIVISRYPPGPGGRMDKLVYYDANDLAMMLVGTLPLTLYFMRRGVPTVIRAIAAASACAYLAAIVKSGSRGGLIGLIAVAAYLILTFSAVPARVRIGASVAGFLILSLYGSDQYWKQMGTIMNPQDDYNWSGKSEMGRMEVWKRGMRYMVDRPITGVGAAAFVVAEGTISPLAGRQEYGYGTKWSAAHNSFVQIGAELGVPGLVAFVALLVVAFRSLGRIARPRPDDPLPRRPQAAMAQALRASLVGYAASGFFLSQGYAVFLYSILGLIVALDGVCRAGSSETLEPAGA